MHWALPCFETLARVHTRTVRGSQRATLVVGVVHRRMCVCVCLTISRGWAAGRPAARRCRVAPSRWWRRASACLWARRCSRTLASSCVLVLPVSYPLSISPRATCSAPPTGDTCQAPSIDLDPPPALTCHTRIVFVCVFVCICVSPVLPVPPLSSPFPPNASVAPAWGTTEHMRR
jgi:hypothetical protein